MMNYYNIEAKQDQQQKFVIMGRKSHEVVDEDEYISEESSSSSFSFDEDSNISKDSSSSLDLIDDASSSSSSPSSPPRYGPLYGLSELMDQLPIKRGLSKFYQGKSQSFTSLENATSLEDLAKKETPYQKRIKACKSYGGGLNNFRSFTQPKATISKKGGVSSRGASLSNLSCLSRKNSFIVGSYRPPLSPVQSTF